MIKQWREVSRDEFFRAVGPQDVHPQPVGMWPYASHFKTRTGDVRAKIEREIPAGHALAVSRYYLPAATGQNPPTAAGQAPAER